MATEKRAEIRACQAEMGELAESQKALCARLAKLGELGFEDAERLSVLELPDISCTGTEKLSCPVCFAVGVNSLTSVSASI
jgi:hypothetical protein